MKAATTRGTGVSPYTPQTVDLAITHLERVLYSQGSDSIFAQTYWRGRVLQIYATLGLVQKQEDRLRRLLDRLATVPSAVNLGRGNHGNSIQITNH